MEDEERADLDLMRCACTMFVLREEARHGEVVWCEIRHKSIDGWVVIGFQGGESHTVHCVPRERLLRAAGMLLAVLYDRRIGSPEQFAYLVECTIGRASDGFPQPVDGEIIARHLARGFAASYDFLSAHPNEEPLTDLDEDWRTWMGKGGEVNPLGDELAVLYASPMFATATDGGHDG